jgi:hypothetical protein
MREAIKKLSLEFILQTNSTQNAAAGKPVGGVFYARTDARCSSGKRVALWE